MQIFGLDASVNTTFLVRTKVDNVTKTNSATLLRLILKIWHVCSLNLSFFEKELSGLEFSEYSALA